MIEVHDIVQITDETHHWFPALITVSEVKSWGVQGYACVLENSPEPCGQAYIRIRTEQFEHVGRAVIV